MHYYGECLYFWKSLQLTPVVIFGVKVWVQTLQVMVLFLYQIMKANHGYFAYRNQKLQHLKDEYTQLRSAHNKLLPALHWTIVFAFIANHLKDFLKRGLGLHFQNQEWVNLQESLEYEQGFLSKVQPYLVWSPICEGRSLDKLLKSIRNEWFWSFFLKNVRSFCWVGSMILATLYYIDALTYLSMCLISKTS